MTAYRVKYQTRRKSNISIHEGDWQDKQKIILADDDAMPVIKVIVSDNKGFDFRLKEIHIMTNVDSVVVL